MVTKLAAVAPAAERIIRVRCWFGEYAIGDYTGPASQAARKGAAWLSRFPGLPVTSEEIPPALNSVTGGPGSDSNR